MRLLRNPRFSAAVIVLISAFYAAVFILTSGHLEFLRILEHGQTLNSDFWNNWSEFLQQGRLKYIGYAYLVLALGIGAFSVFRKKRYDEYQTEILTAGFLATGLVLLFLFPAALLLILSDPNYAVEAVLLLAVAHWTVFLLANLLCAARWRRE